MKKILTLALSLIMVATMSVALTGCGGGSDAEGPTVIHFSSTQGTTHAWYKAAEDFAAAVKDKSNGSLEISVEFGGVNGSDKDQTELVQSGGMDMAIGSTVGLDAVVSQIGFVNLPYFITTYDQVDDLIYNGWVGETVSKDLEDAGLKVLGLTDCDFRWISNSKREIKSAADLKGLKIRTPESKMFLSFFENLGAKPTSMAFVELASALQQGTVDGQDNGPTLSYPNGLHQFNKYWVKSNHSFAAAAVTFNPDKWDSLTADQQKVLQECTDDMCEEIKTLLRQDVVDMEQKMKDEGCTVIEPTEQLTKDMRAAAEKVWQDKEVTANFDQDAVARILSEAGLK